MKLTRRKRRGIISITHIQERTFPPESNKSIELADKPRALLKLFEMHRRPHLSLNSINIQLTNFIQNRHIINFLGDNTDARIAVFNRP